MRQTEIVSKLNKQDIINKISGAVKGIYGWTVDYINQSSGEITSTVTHTFIPFNHYGGFNTTKKLKVVLIVSESGPQATNISIQTEYPRWYLGGKRYHQIYINLVNSLLMANNDTEQKTAIKKFWNGKMLITFEALLPVYITPLILVVIILYTNHAR